MRRCRGFPSPPRPPRPHLAHVSQAAFTLAWEAGIDARRASIAYGCNVDTLMVHYISMDEQAVIDDVFAKMGRK